MQCYHIDAKDCNVYHIKIALKLWKLLKEILQSTCTRLRCKVADMQMGIGRSMLKFRFHEIAQERDILAPGNFKYDLLHLFAGLVRIYTFEPESEEPLKPTASYFGGK